MPLTREFIRKQFAEVEERNENVCAILVSDFEVVRLIKEAMGLELDEHPDGVRACGAVGELWHASIFCSTGFSFTKRFIIFFGDNGYNIKVNLIEGEK